MRISENAQQMKNGKKLVNDQSILFGETPLRKKLKNQKMINKKNYECSKNIVGPFLLKELNFFSPNTESSIEQ